MTNAQLAKRQERAQHEALVIGPAAEGGFRVYAVTDPKRSYLVTGTAQSSQCTCPDFQTHGDDPEWRCKHILAALSQLPAGNGQAEPDRYELEERRAIQDEDRSPRRKRTEANGNGPAHMLVKRSVSPDGRIDSLSVEFTCGVDKVPAAEIKTTARKILALQSDIVEEFLDRPGKPNGEPAEPGNGSPAVPARVVAVGGMDGKWGRRLFINVEANGRTLKLFGKPEELAAHIRAAGYLAPNPFCEGAVLNIPCSITTKPSPDGRYTNVERVLPANQPRLQPVRRIDR